MMRILLISAGFACITLPNCLVGDALAADPNEENSSQPRFSHDASLGYSYAGSAKTDYLGADRGDSHENAMRLSYDLRIRSSDAYSWRLGLGWGQTWLHSPSTVPLPDQLQAINLHFGNRWQFADAWSLITSVEPGIYHDGIDIEGKDINCPFYVGLQYRQNEKLNWMFGLRVNVWSSWPVIPGVGLRWQFADQWALNLMFPRPQLEYQLTEQITLSAGAEFRGGSFRVNDHFADANAAGQILDYRQINAGAGVNWKIASQVQMELFGGYSVYRHYEYDTRNIEVDVDPAPTVTASVRFHF
jgi:hypothetical protein